MRGVVLPEGHGGAIMNTIVEWILNGWALVVGLCYAVVAVCGILALLKAGRHE